MEELVAKMGEFIKMEDELPFPEFQSYYQSVMDYLMKNYQDMTTDQLVQAKGITMIMGNNAKARAMRKVRLLGKCDQAPSDQGRHE